jgi:hypothetical protein
MNTTCKSRLSQFWNHLQHELFPFLREEDHLELSPALEKVIRVLEFTQVDRFIPSSRGFVGRPPKDRVALARAFVAQAVLDLPTTEALIDRLKADRALRRICGFERFHAIPGASRFSRVFAEFTALELPARVHEALIRAQLGDRIVGHIARDSTAIEAREKPAPKAAAVAPAAPSGYSMGSRSLRRLRSHPPRRYRPRNAGARARGRSGPRSRPSLSGRWAKAWRRVLRNCPPPATWAARRTAKASRRPGPATRCLSTQRTATSR